MASAIDPTKPVEGNPTTASVRDNFAAAKTEIETLQATAGVGPRGVSFFANDGAGTITNISAIAGMVVGDHIVNTNANPRTILGVATLTGGIVRSTSATAGVAAGTIRGATGADAGVSVGTTTTVEPPANANVTQGGTAGNRIFNFQIPRGAQGPQGTPGLGAGGLALTSGGTLGQKLVKTGSANGQAAWMGSAEDLPVVKRITRQHNLFHWLELDRPAPANCWLVYWRYSKGWKGLARRWRAIYPWTGNGGYWQTPIPPGATSLTLSQQQIYWMYQVGRPLRGGDRWGSGSAWPEKQNNPYLVIHPSHRNKIQYRFSTCIQAWTNWARLPKSEMSENVLEIMRWVHTSTNSARLITTIY